VTQPFTTHVCDSLTAIIAISWSPHYGRNHMDAVVQDIVLRMAKNLRMKAGRGKIRGEGGLAEASYDCRRETSQNSRRAPESPRRRNDAGISQRKTSHRRTSDVEVVRSLQI